MLSRASLALTALVPVLLLSGCGSAGSKAADSSTSSTATTTTAPAGTASAGTATGGAPAGTASCSYPTSSEGSAGIKVTAPPTTPSTSGTVAVTMKTSIGDIGLSLDADGAPCTVNSFVSLAKQGYFDKTSCHRLTTQGIAVLQCGDPSGTGSGGPGYSFADELTTAKALKTDAEATKQYQAAGQSGDVKTYPAGTIAMANAGPNTNGSQFFLVYADSPLPPAYTVFGTIDAAGVKAIKTDAAAGSDDAYGTGDGHPKKPVDITAVTVG
ncbi:peptidylprolyl isomerase [Nocardioides sp. BP30]|uniref:peptidylprolyl isomerase n=1 Tax=Nocardioides sp. BP30 TaxID=3036374 RepID=UPI0024687814|nr:peptidylprolyl isomerase [Nocardioides sp. BP30]WGL50597.1 peptidylprolyl isomerase [Nocardioides sp. BP30]